MPTRNLFFAAVGFILLFSGHTASAHKYELRLPDNAPVQRFDFEQNGIDNGWQVDNGSRTISV